MNRSLAEQSSGQHREDQGLEQGARDEGGPHAKGQSHRTEEEPVWHEEGEQELQQQ